LDTINENNSWAIVKVGDNWWWHAKTMLKLQEF
jgi:hypothetical protein